MAQFLQHFGKKFSAFTGDKLRNIFNYKNFRTIFLCDANIFIHKINIFMILHSSPSITGREWFTGRPAYDQVLWRDLSRNFPDITAHNMISYVMSIRFTGSRIRVTCVVDFKGRVQMKWPVQHACS